MPNVLRTHRKAAIELGTGGSRSSQDARGHTSLASECPRTQAQLCFRTAGEAGALGTTDHSENAEEGYRDPQESGASGTVVRQCRQISQTWCGQTRRSSQVGRRHLSLLTTARSLGCSEFRDGGLMGIHRTTLQQDLIPISV